MPNSTSYEEEGRRRGNRSPKGELGEANLPHRITVSQIGFAELASLRLLRFARNDFKK
jgi:hypothetical protein